MADNKEERARIVERILKIAREPIRPDANISSIGDSRAQAAIRNLRKQRQVPQEKLDREASV